MRVCVKCGSAGPFSTVDLCKVCYRRDWLSKPGNREKDRAISRAWKTAHREENRRADRERMMRPEYRGTCEVCGGPMGSGSAKKGRKSCQACWDAGIELKRELLVELWADGLTHGQIGAAFGWTKGHLSAEISRCRELGYALPHRRTPEQRARMVAGRKT
jgi:hypothetical protein